ncbi:MAG: response regulator [Anaerolineae bacterium]|nr:response regulator [Anaerolineae bacterium]
MAAKILIIDDDLDTLRLVGLMLKREGYQILEATNGQLGLDRALEDKPNLILLDIMMPDMDGYEVARRLSQDRVTDGIPILMFTAKTQLDDKVAGFEVGADDYLTKPTHPYELQAHVKALLGRKIKSSVKAPPSKDEEQGRVIGMLAARGGLGVSTLVSNLAASLNKHFQTDIILAEITPGQGGLGLDLEIKDGNGLAELITKPTEEITRDAVAEVLISHKAGFKIILAPNHSSHLNLTDHVNQFKTLVTRLSSLGSFIVLDLGVGLNRIVQNLLPLINELIVVVEGNKESITVTRVLIDRLIEFGADKNYISTVLNNRVRSESQMSFKEVQKILGHTIAAVLTPAPELFAQASRLNTPAILCQPDSLTTQQITKLVDQIIAHGAK